MKKIQGGVDQFLPHGELLRGFINQSNVSKGDLKRTLRNRGVFMISQEKEQMVPFLISILLSPAEYNELRDCQNTREDNLKTSSSRIAWHSSKSLIEAIPNIFPMDEIIQEDYVSYRFKYPPSLTALNGNADKVKIDFEIERFDLNKSWYESHNEFSGSLVLEKLGSGEIQILRTYTSAETVEVGNKIERFVVKTCKDQKDIEENKELNKILFSSFNNYTRIIFFWRLTTSIESHFFKFEDLIDVQFRPDASLDLPQGIDWMKLKDQLILKGKEIHNTNFFKEMEYYEYLQVWGLEAKYKIDYLGLTGTITASFEFSNFLKAGENAEIEVKITSVNFAGGLDGREKEIKKQKLLEVLENQKNDIYKNYIEYLSTQAANPQSVVEE